MVDFGQLETKLDRRNGVPVAYGVWFREAKPYHTWEYYRANDSSVHMYVFVDRDNLPVGMSLVHPATPCVAYTEGSVETAEFKKLVLDLYSYLCQLASGSKMVVKAEMERQMKELLVKATSKALKLEQVEMKKAA